MNRAFFVPLQPPSLNDFHGRPRYHLHNIKNAWGKWIEPLTMPKRARVRVRLKVTRFYTGQGFRPYDADNLIGGFKPILDLLKAKTGAGYIVDDSPKWLELEFKQVRGLEPTTHRDGTLLEFEDLS